MARTLVLFDIDGTLLRTNGASVSGFVQAGQDVFGEEFSLEGLIVGGQLDPLILRRALQRLGVEDHESHLTMFRPRYHAALQRLFESGERGVVAMPGVHELLTRLVEHPAMDVGLLTGNLEETGRLKLKAAGIDTDPFEFHAWGDEGEAREHLPPVAHDRWTQTHGEACLLEHIVIIGDTIHDVHCGRANGCRVIGVCTGVDDRATLEAAQADLVVDDLGDVEALLRWLESA